MSLSALKKSRGNLDSLSKLVSNLNKKQSYSDDRIWYPKKDKAGNAYARIRFLLPMENEQAFVQTYSHSFQGPGGKWYIENCPTTIGRDDCPVCHANSVLWNSGIDSEKKIASARKRKLHFISNIYVISDPASPENEGKVFLYKYGKKIMDKIDSCINPKFPNDPKFDPFEFWAKGKDLPGADFELKMCQVEGYPNYDRSVFASPTEFMGGDDKKIEAIWKQQYSLAEFVDPTKFKPAAELEKKLAFVLGKTRTSAPAANSDGDDDTNLDVTEGEGEGEDSLSYYQRLANAG